MKKKKRLLTILLVITVLVLAYFVSRQIYIRLRIDPIIEHMGDKVEVDEDNGFSRLLQSSDNFQQKLYFLWSENRSRFIKDQNFCLAVKHF